MRRMHVTRRIRRQVAARPGRIAAGLLAAAALLAAACGGNEAASPRAVDRTPPAEAASTADAATSTAEDATPAQAEQAPASTAQAPALVAVPQIAERDDGLSGAPVPPPTAQSVAFDAGLVDERAGAFPPLDFPAVVPASEASWMPDDELVLGAVQNGAARAYPIFMLRLHHVANDELGGEPYLVTF